MTKEQAKAVLDTIIDDDGITTHESIPEGPPIANKYEQVAYYGLYSLLEGVVRECAQAVSRYKLDIFLNLLKDSQFDFIVILNKIFNKRLVDFSDEYRITADIRLQNVLRTANELAVATEMCAALNQDLLGSSTYGFNHNEINVADTKTAELVLNFGLKMAYAEILRFLKCAEEAKTINLLEVLYRWQETPVGSEYFRRAILNYLNSDSLVIELPTTEEANAARSVIKELRFPGQMPLTSTALDVFEKITSVYGYADPSQIDDSWNFVEYVD